MPQAKGGETTQLATRIPADLHEWLRAESEETGVPIARLVADAIRLLRNERGKK